MPSGYAVSQRQNSVLVKIAMGSILLWMKANALWDSKDDFGCTMSSHEWVASTSTLLDYIVERSSST